MKEDENIGNIYLEICELSRKTEVISGIREEKYVLGSSVETSQIILT